MLVEVVAQRLYHPQLYGHLYHRFMPSTECDDTRSRAFRKFQDTARHIADVSVGTDLHNCPGREFSPPLAMPLLTTTSLPCSGRFSYTMKMMSWAFASVEEIRAQYNPKCYYWVVPPDTPRAKSAPNPVPPNEQLTLSDPFQSKGKFHQTMASLSFLLDYVSNSVWHSRCDGDILLTFVHQYEYVKVLGKRRLETRAVPEMRPNNGRADTGTY